MEFDGRVVVDMFRRVIPHKNIIDNYAVLTKYDVRDQDTPETLAYELYGDSEYHWVLLIINNIVNVRKDWPLKSREFGDFVSAKYPTQLEQNAVHHYEDVDGYVVDGPTSYPVSNFTYEERINESKGQIKILKPEYLKLFVNNFKNLVA
jgi:hypothetical protein